MNRTLILLLAAALAMAGGPAVASEPVPFGDKDYSPQFKYFIEGQTYDREAWEALTPEQQREALEEVRVPAQERQQALADYYAAAMARWDSAQLRDYCAGTTADDVRLVKIWMGAVRGTLLENKLALARSMLQKAQSRGLDDSDIAALRPHLTEEALADLRSVKAAESLQRQADPEARKYEVPKEMTNAALGGVSGAVGDYTGKSVNRAFDGSLSRADMADPVRAGAGSYNKYEVPKGALNSVTGQVAGQTGKFAGAQVSGALGGAQPRATNATTVKSAAPAPVQGEGAKSTAWTSDAYGYTINTADGRTLTFRDQKQAEAAIRALPNGSVAKITLYGHGSPGMQTVGNASYEAGDTAAMLKGKMAQGGVIQYSGCNTASIGDATLNPAVGLSMLTRRLLYFSVPYWQDRMDGVPADQAKQQWEKTWNADLSRDTSVQMRGTTVCGYRTFGLVPGRLPGLTRVMGNQEATTPGYVAGKLVCYRDGKEVPAP